LKTGGSIGGLFTDLPVRGGIYLVFSSPIFLFLFLPVVLGIYFLIPSKARNAWLLFASLVFYAWGEGEFVFIILVSIVCNYIFGRLVHRMRGSENARLAVLLAAVFNIGLLAIFKYANLLVDTFNVLLNVADVQTINLKPVHLPLGISFFTFQALSYVIDISRGHAEVQKNPLHSGLYIALFPQLIAGPIVRYQHISPRLVNREVTLESFSIGIRRLIIGLGKKVLIANILAVPTDNIFALQSSELTTGLAWFGVICFALQIYYDFSGYSDMAIGLGHMFGFQFRENFNYPYICQSIREYWQRWHLSLTSWLRDYLYIPMGGNRVSPSRTILNLLTVFVLCGLWHGAKWTYLVFGLYHGFFMIIERTDGMKRFMARSQLMRHVYALLILMIGYVIFRTESLSYSGVMLAAMFGFPRGTGLGQNVAMHFNSSIGLALLFGIFGSTPLFSGFMNPERHEPVDGNAETNMRIVTGESAVRFAILIIILILSVMQLASGTYNPFIYFRF
jgi:alginate O-acetyltransferase complex protein AlgI